MLSHRALGDLMGKSPWELLGLALRAAVDQAAFRQDGKALEWFCWEEKPASSHLWAHLKVKFMLADKSFQTPLCVDLRKHCRKAWDSSHSLYFCIMFTTKGHPSKQPSEFVIVFGRRSRDQDPTSSRWKVISP